MILCSLKLKIFSNFQLPNFGAAYNIIKANEELQIITVPAEKDAMFQEQYGSRVLATGETIREALTIFNELPCTFVFY
jgi:hypothetical protein